MNVFSFGDTLSPFRRLFHGDVPRVRLAALCRRPPRSSKRGNSRNGGQDSPFRGHMYPFSRGLQHPDPRCVSMDRCARGFLGMARERTLSRVFFRPVEVAFIDPDQQPPYTGSAWGRERWFGRWREISVLCDERLTRSTRVRIIGIRFGWGVGIQYKVCRL